MPDVDARLERIEQAIHSLTGVTGELARENRTLVQGMASDRTAFRETLRDLNGFVATAGLAFERLERQVGRLAEITEVGFTRMQLAIEGISRELSEKITENNRQIAENSRQIAENNRRIDETNRRIDENNRRIDENIEAIRRLIEILRRGRENGEGPPA
ncbi:MAG: hypothetical protein HYU51_13685 [Candidatus Rokubacteria bacterium]|nr:hypothetical protein [Candidatus Rokubacteria bacterium]